MDLKFSKEDLEFKQEVEGFLDANYPLDIKEKQDRRYPLDKSDVIKWQKILSKRGWFAITWPKEYGGSDLSPTKKYILQNVLAEANTPILIPFGVNMLWDPMATVALGATTGATFVREIFTGSYASDMGNWTADAGKAMRYRDQLNRKDMLMLFNVSAEFAYSLDQRSLADRAKSVAFSSIPDAILVSGQITGEAADLSELKMVKDTVSNLPVLANTGVKHETVEEIFRIADGCIVGSALKYSGDTWQSVDPDRAKDFMERVKKIRSQI